MGNQLPLQCHPALSLIPHLLARPDKKKKNPSNDPSHQMEAARTEVFNFMAWIILTGVTFFSATCTDIMTLIYIVSFQPFP